MTFSPLLQETNAQLEGFLSRFPLGAAGYQGSELGPNELRDLRRCLDKVGLRMEELRRVPVSAREPELPRYIRNLEQLSLALKAAQQRLKATRAQMDAQRDRVARAKAWVNSYRAIL
jgi:SMC interacting uncharacterized protein involved in chromosome segregation